jgi:uncharacterized protein
MRDLLTHPSVTPVQVELILRVIPHVSWSTEQKLRRSDAWPSWAGSCAELHAVQDADRLDAVGGIGVLRCAAFSGVRGRRLLEEGGSTDGCEGHFYDKLLKIVDFIKVSRVQLVQSTGRVSADGFRRMSRGKRRRSDTRL